MKKVGIIAGSRPEIIKLAPLYREFVSREKLATIFTLTGQHGQNAQLLSETFEISSNRAFEIESPTVLSLTETLAGMTSKMGSWIEFEKPDLIVTQGDTSSTFAGSISAFLNGVPVAHVEAGLRTYDLGKPFPEEGIRSMIGRIASLHFAPTPAAVENLLSEGIDRSKIHLVGNTIVDAVGQILGSFVNREPRGKLILATAHRRENWLTEIPSLIESLKDVMAKRPDFSLVWVAHPNPKLRALALNEFRGISNVSVSEPLNYSEFLSLLISSRLVITDSGGVLEEAVSLGVPALVARSSTERNEGIMSGRAQLISPVIPERSHQIEKLVDNPPAFFGTRAFTFGDGTTSVRIVDVIEEFLSSDSGKANR